MRNWLMTRRRDLVRFSRWIVVGCAAALLGIASLPHGPVDRFIAIAGVAAVGMVFLIWLSAVLLTLFKPVSRPRSK